MKLEQQVCSLELAKRLKELDVKQESLWYWIANPHTRDSLPFVIAHDDRPPYQRDGNLSAFTVAELGELLPRRLELGNEEHPAHRLVAEGQDTMWHLTYICAACLGKFHSEYDLTEADVRAKMLVYLLENKLIKLS